MKQTSLQAVLGILALAGAALGLAACGSGDNASVPPRVVQTRSMSQVVSFHHPGILVNQSQLDFIKAQVNAGVEPYASAFNVAKASKYGAIPYTVIGPPATGIIECGSNSSPDYGCSDEDVDAAAAYTQALLWYISGNATYAQQAVAIMNTYATKLTGGHTNSNAPLQSAWSAQKFAPAAEIIRYTYSGWAAADIAKFSTMLNTQYLPYINNGQGNGKNGNWSLSMIDAMIGIGVFNEDSTTFNQAVSMWQQWVPAYFYSAADDGGAPYKFTGGPSDGSSVGWNGQLVFSTATDGVSQETCRDTQHVGLGMAAAFNAAETAFLQGTDLYTPAKTRLIATLEYHAKILMGSTNTSQTAYVSASAFSGLCTGASNKYVPVLKGTMERAYNSLHNRLGYSLPQTLLHIQNDIRPAVTTNAGLGIAMDKHDVLWETLSNAGMPAGDTQAPTTPAGLSATAASSSQINLSWSAASDNVGVAGYKVYRGTTLVGSPTTTSFADTGLAASTTYSYTVKAFDAAGNVSAASNVATATTPALADTQPPTAPVALSAVAASSSQINLSWSAASDNVGVTGYEVFRGASLVGSPTTTSFSDTGLNQATAYSYTVKAIDAAGNISLASNTATATTPAASDTQAPSVPASLTATAASSSQINLSWTASTDNVGVTGYHVYRAGVLIASPTGTSLSDTGLAASTAYSYTVKAYDAAGNVSSASNTATTQAGGGVPVTLTPTDDAYTRDGTNATVNYGSDINIFLKTSSAGSNRNGYLKFSLTGIASASNAKLRVYGSSSASTTVTAYQESSSWTNAGITWNNAPPAGAAVNNVAMGTTVQYYEIDVTSYVQSQLAGGLTTVAFLLTESAGKYTTLNSGDNSTNKPQLVITP